MILEGLIALGCSYGTTESCMAGLDSYVKYNKLDQKAEVIEKNVKQKFPAAHFMGATGALIIKKKYTFMVYRNFWYEGDYSNGSEQKNMVVFKFGF